MFFFFIFSSSFPLSFIPFSLPSLFYTGLARIFASIVSFFLSLSFARHMVFSISVDICFYYVLKIQNEVLEENEMEDNFFKNFKLKQLRNSYKKY